MPVESATLGPGSKVPKTSSRKKNKPIISGGKPVAHAGEEAATELVTVHLIPTRLQCEQGKVWHFETRWEGGHTHRPEPRDAVVGAGGQQFPVVAPVQGRDLLVVVGELDTAADAVSCRATERPKATMARPLGRGANSLRTDGCACAWRVSVYGRTLHT